MATPVAEGTERGLRAGEVLEGTWEEVAAHGPDLAGRRVRLVVLAGDVNGSRGEGPTLAERWSHLIGAVDSGDLLGEPSRASTDETSFSEHLARRRLEGHL